MDENTMVLFTIILPWYFLTRELSSIRLIKKRLLSTTLAPSHLFIVNRLQHSVVPHGSRAHSLANTVAS